MPAVDQSPPRAKLPEDQARLAIHAARTTLETLLKCPELRDADLAGDAGMNTGRMVDALAAQVRP